MNPIETNLVNIIGWCTASCLFGCSLGFFTAALMHTAGMKPPSPLDETIDNKADQVLTDPKCCCVTSRQLNGTIERILCERCANARAQKFFAGESVVNGESHIAEPGQHPLPGVSPTVQLVP